MRTRFFLTVFTCLIGASYATSQRSDLPQTALTIYNQNFGFVKDRRKVHVKSNPDTLFFDNIAQQIEPSSLRFRFLTDPHATLLEQYYAYDLISTDKLLQSCIDKPLTVSLKDGSHYTGTLLRFDAQELILQDADKNALTVIPREQNVKDIHFSPLQDLFTRPTLVWSIATDTLGDQWVEASYQTTGLNWQANYNALLHSNDTQMDLQGFTTLTNESGATYRNVALKLVAGKTHQNAAPRLAMMSAGNAFSKQAGPAFQEKNFSEYHLYTLNRPVTLVNNQTKQIQLLEAFDVPVKKLFIYQGAAKQTLWYTQPLTDASVGLEEGNTNVQVFIEFTNALENHLGMPLPEGTVRLYQADSTDQATEFIGEDVIRHTPKDKKVRLAVGNAFDLTGERKRLDFQIDLGRRMMTEEFEIKLENAQDHPVEILVKEPLYRWNTWDILSSSLPYERYDASTIQFHVPMEKNSKQTLTYTVRYTWQAL